MKVRERGVEKPGGYLKKDPWGYFRGKYGKNITIMGVFRGKFEE